MSRSGGRNLKRRAWLFEQQDGRCYLMEHENCKARDGAMKLKSGKHGKQISIEHVMPRSRKASGQPHYVLLACCDCNEMKGSKLPTVEALALAMRLHAAWIEHARNLSLEENKPTHPHVNEPKPWVQRDGVKTNFAR